MTSMTRDPFPFPRLQNDDDFIGQSEPKHQHYKNSTSQDQQKDPWNRLNQTPTLASYRREIYHYDNQAPVDSLDFVLKANYRRMETILLIFLVFFHEFIQLNFITITSNL